MSDFFLEPHPDKPPQAIQFVNVALESNDWDFLLTYVVEGHTSQLMIPPRAKPYRTDELWRTTCLELFVGLDEGRYLEFNFSPSTEWAAYHFDSYRNGMQPLELDGPPSTTVSDEGYALIVTVGLDLPRKIGRAAITGIGLTAVVEEVDGTKSYWALAHASGPPDFHNADCFTARLPAPEAS